MRTIAGAFFSASSRRLREVDLFNTRAVRLRADPQTQQRIRAISHLVFFGGRGDFFRVQKALLQASLNDVALPRSHLLGG